MSLASDLVVSLVTPPSPMLGSPDLDLNVSALMCNPKGSVYGLACVALNWSLSLWLWERGCLKACLESVDDFLLPLRWRPKSLT